MVDTLLCVCKLHTGTLYSGLITHTGTLGPSHLESQPLRCLIGIPAPRESTANPPRHSIFTRLILSPHPRAAAAVPIRQCRKPIKPPIKTIRLQSASRSPESGVCDYGPSQAAPPPVTERSDAGFGFTSTACDAEHSDLDGKNAEKLKQTWLPPGSSVASEALPLPSRCALFLSSLCLYPALICTGQPATPGHKLPLKSPQDHK